MNLTAQTVIDVEEDHGVYFVPCKVNELPLKFIFDTGASSICISLTEALFMLKNGYLTEDDVFGTEYYQIANGDIEEGTKIRIKNLTIGDITLKDIEATIMHDIDAPLLLGQSALRELGELKFNYDEGTLTINSDTENQGQLDHIDESADVRFITRFVMPDGPNNLYEEPDASSLIITRFTEDVSVSVIENEGVFFKVRVGGLTGYIQKEQLERKW